MTSILLNPGVHLTFTFPMIDQQPFTELITLPTKTWSSFGFQDTILSCLLPTLLVASSPSLSNSSISHRPLNEAPGFHLWIYSLFWIHSPSRWSHSISKISLPSICSWLPKLYLHLRPSPELQMYTPKGLPDISIWMLICISHAHWPNSWSSSLNLLLLKSPSHHSNQLMTILIF